MKAPNRLAGSTIALQRLFLRDVAHSLSLLVPHLKDGDLVALGDAKGNLLASGFDLPCRLGRIVRIFRAGDRNGLGNQTLRAAQVWVTGILGV